MVINLSSKSLMRVNAKLVAAWVILLLGFPTVFGSPHVGAQQEPPYLEWDRQFDGPGAYWDEAFAVALDTSGAVLTCGITFSGESQVDYVTIKYTESGDTSWSAIFDLPASGGTSMPRIGVDRTGNAYVFGSKPTGGPGLDFLLLKYSPEGDLLWERQFDTLGGAEDATAFRVDSGGNAIISGQSSLGFLTVKYDSTGNRLWARSYGGFGSGGNAPLCLSTGPGATIVVGGILVDTTWVAETAFAVVKYSSDGDEVWDWRYVHPGSDGNAVTALAMAASGSVYLAGWVDMDPSDEINFDIVTAKLNPEGNPVWIRQYSGSDPTWQDEPSDLEISLQERVVIAATTGSDCLSLSYDSAGTELWTREFAPGSSGRAVAVDSAGVSYVVGSPGFIASYDAAGNQLWDRSLSTNGSLAAVDVTSDGSGIYAAGLQSSTNGPDMVTVKYTMTCSCPNQGDLDLSGSNDAVDLALVIDAVFFGGAVIMDSTCPAGRADYNVDYLVDAVDLALCIDHTFFGAGGPGAPCAP